MRQRLADGYRTPPGTIPLWRSWGVSKANRAFNFILSSPGVGPESPPVHLPLAAPHELRVCVRENQTSAHGESNTGQTLDIFLRHC